VAPATSVYFVREVNWNGRKMDTVTRYATNGLDSLLKSLEEVDGMLLVPEQQG